MRDLTRPVIRDALRRLEAGEVRRAHGRKGKTIGTGRPRAPATINRYKAALSTVFRYGMEELRLFWLSDVVTAHNTGCRLLDRRERPIPVL